MLDITSLCKHGHNFLRININWSISNKKKTIIGKVRVSNYIQVESIEKISLSAIILPIHDYDG